MSSSIVLLNNLSNINIVETFVNSLGNNIYDTNIQKSYFLTFGVDSSSNQYIEGTLIATDLFSNVSTTYIKKSNMNYEEAILSDSSFISHFDYIINNLYISISPITITYQSIIYTCTKYFYINDNYYYVLQS